MTRKEKWFLVLTLVLMGAGWGLTTPLAKIAVSTGYGYIGLIFWQAAIGSALMAIIALVRGDGLPMHRQALGLYVIVAMTGTIFPDAASYQAFVHLPSGVMSIVLSLVPMISFPMALALRLETFSPVRFLGLLSGLSGVLLLVLPKTSLPDSAMLAWIPLALVAPFFYAFEGNFVAKWGTRGLNPVQLLFGSSLIGAIVTLPLALASGQFISPIRVWAAPEWALVASSVIHVIVYAFYIWLVRKAGPVFAVQTGYLVTGFGIVWAMLILNESYSPFFWAAMGLVLTGVFLVQPTRKEALAPIRVDGQDGGKKEQRVFK